MKSAIVLIFVIICLLSCAKKQPFYDLYNPPSLQTSAELYLDIPADVHVSLFSDAKCSLGKYGTRVEYDRLRGVPEVDGYRPKHAFAGKLYSINLETEIPQVVNLTRKARAVVKYSGTQALSICSITYQFTPLENHTYVAVFEPKNNGCSATIIDLTLSQVNNTYVIATGLKPTETNCDIYEYYPDYKSK